MPITPNVEYTSTPTVDLVGGEIIQLGAHDTEVLMAYAPEVMGDGQTLVPLRVRRVGSKRSRLIKSDATYVVLAREV